MPRIKIMTLNLWGYRGRWGERRNRLIRMIKQEEIDILLLQEVAERAWHPNQGLELARLSGYAMEYVPAKRVFSWPAVSSGLAILSRYPISNQLVIEIMPAKGVMPKGEKSRRILQRAEISLDGLTLTVINTHLPVLHDARLLATTRLWTQVAQEESTFVFVGGDFNARPEDPAIQFLQGEMELEGVSGSLIDCWPQAGVGTEMTFPSDKPRARIDYIFYIAEPAVIVREVKVLGFAPDVLSDHAGVVATFDISPTAEQAISFDDEPVNSLEQVGESIDGEGSSSTFGKW